MICRRSRSRRWRLAGLPIGGLAGLSAAGPVAAHGGATTPASPPVAGPEWAAVAGGFALVALSVALLGRRLGGGRATRTVAAVFLAGAVLVAVGGATGVGLPAGAATETPLWVSDTGRSIGGNHHAAAVADGRVYAPVSGPGTSAGCELVAIHGADGGVVWRAPVETNCTIHAVADPAVADADGDGDPEVLVATTEEDLRAYDRDGRLLRESALADYGYTRPAVADVAGDGRAETVVVDVTGTVWAFDPAGAPVWRVALDDYVWARPVAGDVDGDGAGEVFVARRDGTLTLLSGPREEPASAGARDEGPDGSAPNGTVEWSTRVGDDPGVSWLASGDADGDPALELVVATVDGGVYAVDGATGAVEWRRDVGSLAAVGGFGDGDGDGDPEVYVTDSSGTVRALDAATGEEEWATGVTDGAVQMMPPPSLGDTDGDGSPDLIVPAHDGSVSKLDPADGTVVARYERSVDAAATDRGFDRVFARATLGDVDGDGDDDAVVVYADGTVVALDF
jgi:outer membrane protein assembly factor BamB